MEITKRGIEYKIVDSGMPYNAQHYPVGGFVIYRHDVGKDYFTGNAPDIESAKKIIEDL